MPRNGDTKIVETIIYRAEANRILSSKSGAEAERIKKLLMYSTGNKFKSITTYKYRNAGKNSGWYIYNVTVTNI